jgi:hypothetical protein
MFSALKPYPRLRTEPWFEKYAQEAAGSLRRLSRRANVQFSMTDDPFDAVLAFYKNSGTERPDFAKGFLSNLRAKSGRDVKATYVVFDGAASPLRSNYYVSIQRPVVVQFEPLEVHDVTQIMVFRNSASRVASLWRKLAGNRFSRRQDAAEHVKRIDLHERSEYHDPKWPIRSSGTTAGIAWTLFVRPALENSDGPKGPDAIWWETDAVRAGAFVAVVGYRRAGTLEWRGLGGVRRYEDVEGAADVEEEGCRPAVVEQVIEVGVAIAEAYLSAVRSRE